jgi:hypothetical protein
MANMEEIAMPAVSKRFVDVHSWSAGNKPEAGRGELPHLECLELRGFEWEGEVEYPVEQATGQHLRGMRL